MGWGAEHSELPAVPLHAHPSSASSVVGKEPLVPMTTRLSASGATSPDPEGGGRREGL